MLLRERNDKYMFYSILNTARAVRNEMVCKYGADLAGHCIEASDIIVERLADKFGLEAVAVEGWCKFDDEYYGSDRPWDPHTWVEIPSLGLYVDVTADQFNSGMYAENEFDSVIVCKGLPNGMQYEEPSWDDFEEVIRPSSLNEQISKAQGLFSVANKNPVVKTEIER